MNTTINQEQAALCVSGPDAKKFLQGQLTCNLDEVTSSEFRLGAHCNPQGRIISFFRLFFFDDSYYLVMPQDLVEIAMNALKKYAVFFKVSLSITTLPDTLSTQNFTRASDIQSGIPQIHAITSGKFLPHELNLQLINAISFNKGCYTGQEIIARMHYRGQLKNHMYRALLSSDTALHPGEDLLVDHQVLGTIVDAATTAEGTEILFVANKQDVANTSLSLLPLPYSLS